ncbi:MAG: sensor histidine kinase [Roseburia sp.]|nr:sensor histidine kinase [Roseburia sp.]
MRFAEYLRDSIPVIVVQVLCMVLLSLFLLSAGNSADTVGLVLLIWLAVAAAYMTVRWYRRRGFLMRLSDLAEALEEKYLIAELMEKPRRADDSVFYRILKLADKSMLERVADAQREKREYREQVEQWVHEAKTPITAMRLLCENNPTAIQKPLLLELERLNHYVEQALYLSGSEHTEKDYRIRELVLVEAVHQAIAQNKQLLLQNQVRLCVEPSDVTAYTDERWLVFILSQLLNNAVKYKSDTPVIEFRIAREGERVLLTVADNGIGIPAEDMPRIFEKGFVGRNGRGGGRATGMGLYLCRRLCERLGVGLKACSDGDGRTVFTLMFYENPFVGVR